MLTHNRTGASETPDDRIGVANASMGAWDIWPFYLHSLSD
jgi:hypothetical protein